MRDELRDAARAPLRGRKDHRGVLPPVVHLRKGSDRATLRWSLERVRAKLEEPQPGGDLVTYQFQGCGERARLVPEDPTSVNDRGAAREAAHAAGADVAFQVAEVLGLR